jgi:hypothetical protein
MEPQERMSPLLTSFASVIIGVSASHLLSNSFFSYQSLPYQDDFRAWSVLFISLLAYLIGFVIILDIGKYLDRSVEHSRRLLGSRELSLLLASCMVVLIILIGILGFSLKYLNILSYTVYVFAFSYFIATEKKKSKFMLFALFVGGWFLLLPLPVLDLTTGLTHLDEVSILKVIENEDEIHLEMDTILYQKNNNATDIYVEMIFFDGTVKDNAECIKVVEFLEEDLTSKLHWSITLQTKNEKCVIYLFIWSSLGENEYSKIEIMKCNGEWKPFHRELELLEYSEVYYHSRLKKIIQRIKIFFEVFENH